jgi:glycosyltransferase involved in cell wall biosynthesis
MVGRGKGVFQMKVLFIYTVNPGVAYYRLVCFAQKMGKLGIAHCRMFPDWNTERFLSPDWERNLGQNIHELEEQINWADVVVCQYVDSAEGFSFVQATMHLKPCLMEIDDNLAQVPHQFPVYEQNRPGDAQHLWSTRQMVESNAVITTTEYLAVEFRKYNATVKVIPNCIDFDVYDSMKSHSNELVRLGWIGGATHGSDLKLIQDVLYKVLDKYERSEVYIVSCPPPEWPKHERLHMVNRWVPIDKYPSFLKELSFDIGLCPLRDNAFNRGKSNLRYLEYSACKIPTIASDVEPFRKDYKGPLANTDEEWFDHISKLIEDLDYRLQTGWNGYYHVKDNFNLDHIAVEYADFLKEQIGWQKPNALSVMAFEQINMDAKLV